MYTYYFFTGSNGTCQAGEGTVLWSDWLKASGQKRWASPVRNQNERTDDNGVFVVMFTCPGDFRSMNVIERSSTTNGRDEVDKRQM